ncbi:MAG: tetratricopeptide repeat protein [Cyclobacteriaceae bacterium]
MSAKVIKIYVKLPVLSGLLFLSLNLKAQTSTVTTLDSLKNAYTQANNDNDRLSAIVSLAYYYSSRNIRKADSVISKGIPLWVDADISSPNVNPFEIKGIIERSKGNYMQSLAYLKESLQVYENAIDQGYNHYTKRNYARVHQNVGLTYRAMGLFVEAVESYKEALYIYEKLMEETPEDLTLFNYVSDLYDSLGGTYSLFGINDLALGYYQKSMDLKLRLEDAPGMMHTFMHVGNLHFQREVYDSALYFYRKTLNLADGLKNKSIEALCYGQIGEMYLLIDKIELGAISLYKALELHQEASNQKELVKLQARIAKYYYLKKNYKEALKWLNQCLRSREIEKDPENKAYALGLLGDVYTATNKHKEALDVHQMQKEIEDSLSGIQIKQKILEIENRFLIKKQNMENELLAEQQSKSRELMDLTKQHSFHLIGMVILLFALAFFNYRLWQKAKKANESLSEKNAALTDLLRENEGLMSIVAHDLKSPLNKIKGLGDLLDMSGPLSDEQKKIMGMINSEVLGGMRLIRDLLDLNASFETNQSIPKGKVDLSRTLQKVTDSFTEIANSKKLTIHNYFETPLVIKSNQDYIQRIADNLISNAIKFSPQGRNIFISSYRSNGKVAFSIRDEGPGFSEEDMKNMYKKFKKLSARPTAGEYSTGLGLSIIKTLTDKLDGKIVLKTNRRKGSEFIVFLPPN